MVEEAAARVAALEQRQLFILQSIANLELRLSGIKKLESSGGHTGSSAGDCTSEDPIERREPAKTPICDIVEQRLSKLLQAAGASEFVFKTVPSDYYDRSYEQRRDLLSAASVDHLCKSIVMVNTQAHESVKDCSDRKNSKYYVIVIQYTARLNAEKVKAFVHSLNEGKIPKKRFNLRLAPEEESNQLTGFEHNAVTPIGMRTDIPVILSDAIVQLSPRFFWLGGGEVDLKLGTKTDEFIKIVKPFITDCTY
ncbi:uncharacterized protein [Physcomitrium patens]|uniref:YbaK/aminoacyl-tRNA synthetase-associated domain-containing protein n=1 Tax=Physcomitrium patens TaxID=3218 RepID=A0A2K1IFF2_PHYPA|nr:uncharacterized protein LOC112276647 [Physcomitrium patens]PNR28000.1 hypothetical protein PHYPA_028592 [Physcomitrium patens]|eukprot:XP_024363905.1 uncharacterized protein LOC112276647 [Physcomitrella patens]